jgi:hypothetical protein
MLDQGLPKNEKVSISEYRGGWISVADSDVQPEPRRLAYLKREIANRWWMTNFTDILKEADLRVGFTELFQTLATYERLDRKTIQKRLLLCLFGLGTNTGLKRVSSDNADVTYKDLLYIKRKYIYKYNVKAANEHLVNAIIADRREEIWGKGTTSCASDSTRVAAYDQYEPNGTHDNGDQESLSIGMWRKSPCAFIRLLIHPILLKSLQCFMDC